MEPTLPVLVASVLMVLAGLTKRRFASRRQVCRVCGNPRELCTCRWL
jgi:hypothetical protein